MPEFVDVRTTLDRLAVYSGGGKKMGKWIGDMLSPTKNISFTLEAANLLTAMVFEYVNQTERRTSLADFQEARSIATWLNSLAA